MAITMTMMALIPMVVTGHYSHYYIVVFGYNHHCRYGQRCHDSHYIFVMVIILVIGIGLVVIAMVVYCLLFVVVVVVVAVLVIALVVYWLLLFWSLVWASFGYLLWSLSWSLLWLFIVSCWSQ